MERKTYLGRYKISLDERGEPMALGRSGSTVTLKAEDTTSGEPVVLEVKRPGPLEQVPLPELETEARAAQQLDHINIARVRDFGTEDGDIVYVREFLEGSTLDAWVHEHGPLPVAAVMRIGLQGVQALAAAAFQSVTHRAIQPSSLMIVPGQTPDGDWPLVKMLNFGAPAPTFTRNGFTTTGPGELAQFTSPEQLQGATPDFQSDIYSLGATLWFLLTGAAPRAGMVQRSRGIPKNVAAVITRMLASNPAHRPHDPLVLQEEIRACLGRAERRESIGRRFGLPAAIARPKAAAAAPVAAAGAAAAPIPAPASVVVPMPAEPVEEEAPVAEAPAVTGPPSVGRFLLRPLAWAAALLALGMLGAMILPGAVRTVRNWQTEQEPEEIGVKVGVPDSTANAVAAVPTATASTVAANDPQTAAPAAPEISPPQETTIAANRTAPAGAASPRVPSAAQPAATSGSDAPQPVVAAAPTSSVPDASSDATTNNAAPAQSAAPAIAYMNNAGAAQSAQTAPAADKPQEAQSSTAATRTSRAPIVAANTSRPAEQATEPAAPAEGPSESTAQTRNAARQSRTTAQRDPQPQTPTSQSTAPKTASASAEGERKTVARSASKSTRSKAASRTGLTAEEQTELEVRQALPITPEDEAALPPIPRGSKRARYLGTRPDGSLVFGMPSSERVFVAPPAPPGSPRRVIRRALPEAEPPPRAEPVDPAELEEAAPPLDEDEE